MTENLFDDPQEKIEFDQNKNYLEDLVGDGKKFKDVEALAKGKAFSDATIDILTKKMDELRTDYLKLREENTAQAKLQEYIDRLEKLPEARERVAMEPEAKDSKTDGLKMEDIESLFESKIEQREAATRERQNFDTVQNKLKERYGDNSSKFLTEQMQNLGLSREDINSMAKKQPNVLIKALGLDQTPVAENFRTPLQSSKRQDSFAPTAGQKRTWSHYQELKKNNPRLYHDPQTNIQMQKDYLELGAAFEDGDFHSAN